VVKKREEGMAKSLEYVYISALAYCSISKVKRWDIGELENPLKDWRLL
jgi:hypothetical protein